MFLVQNFVVAALDEVLLKGNGYLNEYVVQFVIRNHFNLGMVLSYLVERKKVQQIKSKDGVLLLTLRKNVRELIVVSL